MDRLPSEMISYKTDERSEEHPWGESIIYTYIPKVEYDLGSSKGSRRLGMFSDIKEAKKVLEEEIAVQESKEWTSNVKGKIITMTWKYVEDDDDPVEIWEPYVIPEEDKPWIPFAKKHLESIGVADYKLDDPDYLKQGIRFAKEFGYKE